MNKYPAIIIGTLLVIMMMWVSVTTNPFVRPLVQELDNIGYDYQLRFRLLTHSDLPKNPIVIIDIDNRSLQIEGHWPWPRSKLATLVDKLHDLGISIMTFDLFFPERQPNIANELLNKLNNSPILASACITSIKSSEPLFEEDTIFAKSIAANNVVLPYAFLNTAQVQNKLPAPLISLTSKEDRQLNLSQANGYLANIPILQQAAQGSGFINVEPDLLDGIARRANLIMEYKGGIYPAISLQTVLQLFGDKLTLVTPVYGDEMKLEGLKLGSLIIPTDEKGHVIIPFIGRSHTFKYYSATDILNGKISKDELVGKIAIIGSSSTGLSDLHATAISANYPGVEIQATLLNGILQNNFSYKPAWTYSANLSFIFIFGLIAAFLFPNLGPRPLTISVIIMPIILMLLNNWIWEKTHLILSFNLVIILGYLISTFNIIYGYFFETLKRQRLKTMFGQYVPDEHIDDMLKETSDYALHGEDREMTVLFADIRNFTSISENMTAEELVKMLNSYLTQMTEIIFNHQGTIDKYVGDNIMAFWGAPQKDLNHTSHALHAALEMHDKVKSIRDLRKDTNSPEIHIGIGINSGIMSVGDMGSTYRRNYTVLGDAVNLASRVEQLTKFYGVGIIVAENTYKDQNDFIFRKLDRVRVVGKKYDVDIYELVCLKKDITPKLDDEVKLHHQAMELYYKKQWGDSLAIFETLHRQHPHSKLYKIYTTRISEYQTSPPPDNWNGVYEHLMK